MHSHYLVVLLAFPLLGCVHPSRSMKPGTNYVNSSGVWVEVGTDGKPRPVALPLDQAPPPTPPPTSAE
jgi:hypothetical protein